MDKTLYCGDCPRFLYQDIYGWGLCELGDKFNKCDEPCEYGYEKLN